jgi:SAM-dependent methyltransferase
MTPGEGPAEDPRAAEAFWRALGHQLGRPTGGAGRLVGRLMGRINASPNRHAIEALDLQPRDRVLEVGFGPGLALSEGLRRSEGPHAGIDASVEMVELAGRRNRHAIRSGRLDLVLGVARDLPWADSTFDKALLVNMLYFADARGLDIARVRRALRPGGVMVAYVTDGSTMGRWPFASGDTHRLFDASSLTASLLLAGFQQDHIEVRTIGLSFGIRGLLGIARSAI